MSDLDPLIIPEKDLKKQSLITEFKQIFLLGIVVGSGLMLTSSALITLVSTGFIKQVLWKWENIPIYVWVIFLIIFIGLFVWIYSKFNEESDN